MFIDVLPVSQCILLHKESGFKKNCNSLLTLDLGLMTAPQAAVSWWFHLLSIFGQNKRGIIMLPLLPPSQPPNPPTCPSWHWMEVRRVTDDQSLSSCSQRWLASSEGLASYKKSAIKLRYSEESLHLIGKGLCFDVCSVCVCVRVYVCVCVRF